MADSSRTKIIKQTILDSRLESYAKDQSVLIDIIVTNWLESQIDSPLDLNKVLHIVTLTREGKYVGLDLSTGMMNPFMTALAHLTSISNLLDYNNTESKRIIEIIYRVFIENSVPNSYILNSIFHSLKQHDIKTHKECPIIDTLNRFYIPALADKDRSQKELLAVPEQLIKFKTCPWTTKAYEASVEGVFPADIAVLFR